MSDTGAPEQPGPPSPHPSPRSGAGSLHAIGGFDANELNGEEQAIITEKKSWFFFSEAFMAGMMAATIAVPAGVFFAQKTAAPLAVIGAVLLFLPLFAFQRDHQNPKVEKNALAFFESSRR